ncbi:DUF397 domain-containing protein [Streptomyces himalayensis]|uniref:DUF397 domain-containing protein n=1 Tax=Streptomyces himalayensis subsp. himalayensis TaxID=2756131 RepID=A0A7W0DVN4_9ACTN|nr:DUF397 domain-containing protein [Streptomyces himalayensis]MBA2951765.1 DUF397 domain-containing protein [Streptomyces himalayensis subsp. himalayensis]
MPRSERRPPTAHIPVRDSKHPHGPAVLFAPTAWTTFIGARKTDTRST